MTQNLNGEIFYEIMHHVMCTGIFFISREVRRDCSVSCREVKLLLLSLRNTAHVVCATSANFQVVCAA
jgi:hypothetical protein